MVVARMIPPCGLSNFAHKSGLSGDHTAQLNNVVPYLFLIASCATAGICSASLSHSRSEARANLCTDFSRN